MDEQLVNISSDNIYGSCTLKCAYSFTYNESNNLIAKNDEGVRIRFTYDQPKVDPVTYNTYKYKVEQVCIYSPSLHLYNGTHTPGELIVKHTPTMGGNNLYICVPMIESSESSTASNLITQVIDGVSSNVPSPGDGETNMNIPGFSLQQIIPSKPFYSYTNTSDEMAGDYILFGRLTAIPLNTTTITKLSNLINPYAIAFETDEVYFNKLGPNTSVENEGIYISCQPTGSSDETVDIVNSTSPIKFADIVNNPVVMILLQLIGICLIFICIIGLFKMFKSGILSGIPSGKDIIRDI